MIKINTLTEQQIDNIPICEIDLGSRIINILFVKDIKTLLDLKNFVIKEGMFGLYRLQGFGSVAKNNVQQLLKHSYPKTNFDMYATTTEKYTFRDA